MKNTEEKEIIIDSNKWAKVFLYKERDFYVVFDVEYNKISETETKGKINTLQVFSTKKEAEDFIENQNN